MKKLVVIVFVIVLMLLVAACGQAATPAPAESQEEAAPAQEEAVEEASKRCDPLTDEEKSLLHEMRKWAQRERYRTDSKAQTIIDWIENNLKTNGEWNHRLRNWRFASRPFL